MESVGRRKCARIYMYMYIPRLLRARYSLWPSSNTRSQRPYTGIHRKTRLCACFSRSTSRTACHDATLYSPPVFVPLKIVRDMSTFYPQRPATKAALIAPNSPQTKRATAFCVATSATLHASTQRESAKTVHTAKKNNDGQTDRRQVLPRMCIMPVAPVVYIVKFQVMGWSPREVFSFLKK